VVLGSRGTCGVSVTSKPLANCVTVSGIHCPVSFRFMTMVLLLTVMGLIGLLKTILATTLVPTVALFGGSMVTTDGALMS
jgi:hypothetical protein